MSATSETVQRPISAASDAVLKEVKIAAALGVIGGAIAFAGAIAFLLRVRLAEAFLGAHVWFNTPVTEADAQKIFAVTIQTCVVTGWGLLTAVVAFGFAFIKWTQLQSNPERG